ncbi:MAG: hypothetical protein AAB492_05325 [Patescibacteria group bacterium]
MKMKKLQEFVEELTSYTPQTIKCLYWTVQEVCTMLETSLDKDWVEYKLHQENEDRSSVEVPTPKQEAQLLQKLENAHFFQFQPAIIGAGKPRIFGGEKGLSGEAAIKAFNDPRTDLEIKYDWGWLVNPDLDALRDYLVSITRIVYPSARKIPCRFENNAFFITLKDGTEKSITFGTRRDTRYMLAFFKVFYEHWQRFGVEPLEKSEIRRRMKKEGVAHEISDNFIKNTASNIRKKIDSAKLSDPISLEYDRVSDGFYLDIKIPS